MMPEPEPPVPPGFTTVICTTEGRTALATASGDPARTGVLSRVSVVSGVALPVDDPVLSGVAVLEVVLVELPCCALYAAAPPMPPATPSTSAPARTPVAAPRP